MKIIQATHNPVDNFITTVNLLRDLVRDTTDLTDIKNRYASIIFNENDPMKQAEKIFNYFYNKFKYVRDTYGVEEFKKPATAHKEILEKGYFIGDCDDASIFLAHILRLFGFRVRFEIMAIKDKKYDHIRVAALIKDRWVPLDLTSKLGFDSKRKSHLNLLVFEV